MPLLHGYYDTTIGSKREGESYERIAREIGTPVERIVFFSDNEHELDAAKSAGVQTIQLARPQDGTSTSAKHVSVPSFEGIHVHP